MKTEPTADINKLQRDRSTLRSALITIIGESERPKLEEMKKGFEALKTLGLGERNNIDAALVGIQALLDTI